jgi:serine/threonine protein phosphatase PrpC
LALAADALPLYLPQLLTMSGAGCDATGFLEASLAAARALVGDPTQMGEYSETEDAASVAAGFGGGSGADLVVGANDAADPSKGLRAEAVAEEVALVAPALFLATLSSPAPLPPPQAPLPDTCAAVASAASADGFDRSVFNAFFKRGLHSKATASATAPASPGDEGLPGTIPLICSPDIRKQAPTLARSGMDEEPAMPSAIVGGAMLAADADISNVGAFPPHFVPVTQFMHDLAATAAEEDVASKTAANDGDGFDNAEVDPFAALDAGVGLARSARSEDCAAAADAFASPSLSVATVTPALAVGDGRMSSMHVGVPVWTDTAEGDSMPPPCPPCVPRGADSSIPVPRSFRIWCSQRAANNPIEDYFFVRKFFDADVSMPRESGLPASSSAVVPPIDSGPAFHSLVFGVADGHGGTLASSMAAQILPKAIFEATKNASTFEAVAHGLRVAFLAVDFRIRDQCIPWASVVQVPGTPITVPAPNRAGACVAAVLIRKIAGRYALFSAHSGDSRTIIARYTDDSAPRTSLSSEADLESAAAALSQWEASADAVAARAAARTESARTDALERARLLAREFAAALEGDDIFSRAENGSVFETTFVASQQTKSLDLCFPAGSQMQGYDAVSLANTMVPLSQMSQSQYADDMASALAGQTRSSPSRESSAMPNSRPRMDAKGRQVLETFQTLRQNMESSENPTVDLHADRKALSSTGAPCTSTPTPLVDANAPTGQVSVIVVTNDHKTLNLAEALGVFQRCKCLYPLRPFPNAKNTRDPADMRAFNVRAKALRGTLSCLSSYLNGMDKEAAKLQGYREMGTSDPVTRRQICEFARVIALIFAGDMQPTDLSFPARVGGCLAVTRALGNFFLKDDAFSMQPWSSKGVARGSEKSRMPFVTAEPEVTARFLKPADRLVVVGSDGVFDDLDDSTIAVAAFEFLLDDLATHKGDEATDSDEMLDEPLDAIDHVGRSPALFGAHVHPGSQVEHAQGTARRRLAAVAKQQESTSVLNEPGTTLEAVSNCFNGNLAEKLIGLALVAGRNKHLAIQFARRQRMQLLRGEKDAFPNKQQDDKVDPAGFREFFHSRDRTTRDDATVVAVALPAFLFEDQSALPDTVPVAFSDLATVERDAAELNRCLDTVSLPQSSVDTTFLSTIGTKTELIDGSQRRPKRSTPPQAKPTASKIKKASSRPLPSPLQAPEPSARMSGSLVSDALCSAVLEPISAPVATISKAQDPVCALSMESCEEALAVPDRLASVSGIAAAMPAPVPVDVAPEGTRSASSVAIAPSLPLVPLQAQERNPSNIAATAKVKQAAVPLAGSASVPSMRGPVNYLQMAKDRLGSLSTRELVTGQKTLFGTSQKQAARPLSAAASVPTAGPRVPLAAVKHHPNRDTALAATLSGPKDSGGGAMASAPSATHQTKLPQWSVASKAFGSFASGSLPARK